MRTTPLPKATLKASEDGAASEGLFQGITEGNPDIYTPLRLAPVPRK